MCASDAADRRARERQPHGFNDPRGVRLADMHSNANYATLLDHPKTFGRPATEVWDTLWPMLKPLAEKCYTGECVYHQNDLLLYDKNERGRLREKYHVS